MLDVLLVEDDPVLGRGLSINLELAGYKVHWAKSLIEGSEIHQKSPLNLIVLDLNLPDGNGISFLKVVRESNAKLPVIILTAKTDEDSVVEGLQAGANDYVRKPFGQKELLARIKTVLREPESKQTQIRYGELLLLQDQRKIMAGDAEVDLHRREYDILSYFMEHAEAVVSRQTLLSFLDKDGEIFDRTIDSHVSHVRARLRQAQVKGIQISSVYGIGYRLEKI